MVDAPPSGRFNDKASRRRRECFATKGAANEAPFGFASKCRIRFFKFSKSAAVELLFCLLLAGLVPGAPLLPNALEAGMNGPWETRGTLDAKPIPPSGSPAQQMLTGAVRFFQEWISPIDGPRCGFYPSCSAYALEAVSARGAVEGVLMTADRLMRCTPWKACETHYPEVPDGRFFDPPVACRLIPE